MFYKNVELFLVRVQEPNSGVWTRLRCNLILISGFSFIAGEAINPEALSGQAAAVGQEITNKQISSVCDP